MILVYAWFTYQYWWERICVILDLYCSITGLDIIWAQNNHLHGNTVLCYLPEPLIFSSRWLVRCWWQVVGTPIASLFIHRLRMILLAAALNIVGGPRTLIIFLMVKIFMYIYVVVLIKINIPIVILALSLICWRKMVVVESSISGNSVSSVTCTSSSADIRITKSDSPTIWDRLSACLW